jgi:DnaJ-class molecular chaperone
MATHYETLGVAENATPEELKSAFRRLAKQHHPDMGGDVEKFQQINEAYNTLSDANSRAHYDHTLRNPQPQFNHNPYAQAQHREFHFNFGGGPDPMAAFHDQFFSQFGFQTRQQPKNRNLRVQLDLQFLDTLHNQNKIIEFKTSNNTERLNVELPAGIEDGYVFTIPGRGDDANPGIPRGNLEIQIRIHRHERFVKNNENIMEDITIDAFQAMLGCNILVLLPSGKTIELHIPAGTQHQGQFGITDEGFPRQNGVRGKYIARINIKIPTVLTTEQLNLIKEIQKIKPINT